MENKQFKLATLEEIIKDPKTYTLLQDYSNTRFVGENISFLKSTHQYENILLQSAAEVWDSFRNSQSPCLTPDIRDLLDKLTMSPEITMFQELRNDVSLFLLKFVLPSFEKSVEKNKGGLNVDYKSNPIHVILRDPKQRKKLMSTARKLGAHAEVSFWCMVEQWEDDIYKHALSIWDKYISAESLTQINISAATRNNLRQRIAVPKMDTFMEAKEEISLLVVLEVLPGFELWLAKKAKAKKTDPLQELPMNTSELTLGEIPSQIIRSQSSDSGLVGNPEGSKNRIPLPPYTTRYLVSELKKNRSVPNVSLVPEMDIDKILKRDKKFPKGIGSSQKKKTKKRSEEQKKGPVELDVQKTPLGSHLKSKNSQGTFDDSCKENSMLKTPTIESANSFTRFVSRFSEKTIPNQVTRTSRDKEVPQNPKTHLPKKPTKGEMLQYLDGRSQAVHRIFDRQAEVLVEKLTAMRVSQMELLAKSFSDLTAEVLGELEWQRKVVLEEILLLRYTINKAYIEEVTTKANANANVNANFIANANANFNAYVTAAANANVTAATAATVTATTTTTVPKPTVYEGTRVDEEAKSLIFFNTHYEEDSHWDVEERNGHEDTEKTVSGETM